MEEINGIYVNHIKAHRDGISIWKKAAGIGVALYPRNWRVEEEGPNRAH